MNIVYMYLFNTSIPIIQSDFPCVVKVSNEMTMYEVYPYYKVILDKTPDVSCVKPGYLSII